MKIIRSTHCWYQDISNKKHISPRCPFGVIDQCPRFYQSTILLNDKNRIEAIFLEDEELTEKWEHLEQWVTGNYETRFINGEKSIEKGYFNLCPEVSYKHFELYVSDLIEFDNPKKREKRHKKLLAKKKDNSDWRWNWKKVIPLHYSRCQLYPILLEEKNNPPDIGNEPLPNGKDISLEHNNTKTILLVFSFLLFSCFLWLFENWIHWPWLRDHRNNIYLKICGQLFLAIVFVWLIVKKSAQILWRWIAIMVAIILAFLSFSK